MIIKSLAKAICEAFRDDTIAILAHKSRTYRCLLNVKNIYFFKTMLWIQNYGKHQEGRCRCPELAW